MHPPPPQPNSANKPKLAIYPHPLQHFGTWKLRWIANFFIACGQRKSCNKQKQTSLLTHCTNSCPLNFDTLNSLPRNSGVKVKVWNGAEKAPAKIACMLCYTNLHQISTRPPIGPFTFYSNLYLTPQLWEQKLGWNLQQLWSNRFVFFPCAPCVSASTRRQSQHPCPKFDIAALLYDIYNACILKQRSNGASSEMHLFPAKVGANYAPRSPQECRISSKCHWFRYNSKYLAFRWGTRGFELGE